MFPLQATSRARLVTLAFALGLLGCLLAASSSSAASFTWTGEAAIGESKWSNPTNWEGGKAPSGTVETLTFPKLANASCAAFPFGLDCYTTENDITGLAAGAIHLESTTAETSYNITGKSLALGAGGLQKPAGYACVYAPLALTAGQSWSLDGGFLAAETVMGASANLELTLAHSATLASTCNEEFDEKADIEVGATAIVGADPSQTGAAAAQNGAIRVTRLNATDSAPVTLTHAEIRGPSTIGELSVIGGYLAGEGVSVAGSLTLDSASAFEQSDEFGFMFATEVSGSVSLGSSELILVGYAASEGKLVCPEPKPGEVFTLIAATGTISGTFAGVPNGGTVEFRCVGTHPKARIEYTAHAVTATIAGAPPAQAPTNTGLPVASGGAAPGQTLSCSTGSWTGNPAPVFTYVWLRNGAAIGGATGSAYVVQTGDEGSTLSCQVTATNSAGSAKAVSGGVSIPTPGPVPILGVQAIAGPHSGTVLVRTKISKAFVALTEGPVRVGSEVDATNGRVTLTFATPGGGIQTTELYGGRFLVTQSANGIVIFTLSLPLTGCKRMKLPHGVIANVSRVPHGPKTKVRHLWVTETGGNWGTVGRFVSTSVQGTTWLTQDECTRSQVKVTAGKVKVTDLVRKKTKTISAGGHYTANAKRKH
jgi:hypothetical protein